jgi:hypothetical protein
MRKRFLLLALVLAVIVGLLTAATYITTRDHMILHGDKTSGQISGILALASAPTAPRPGVPANATVTKVTLHGDSLPTKGGVKTNALGRGRLYM